MAATEAFLSLLHVCAEKDLNICGVLEVKGPLKAPFVLKLPRIPHDWAFTASLCLLWFVCGSLVRVEQAFSVSNALDGHVRTPSHSRKEHAVYEHNCQPAFKKRFSIQTEWCTISNENTFFFAEHSTHSLQRCNGGKSTEAFNPQQHILCQRPYDLRKGKRFSCSIACTRCNQLNCGHTESFAFVLVFSLRPWPHKEVCLAVFPGGMPTYRHN